VRSEQEIDAVIDKAAARSWLTQAGFDDGFCRGVAEALEWVLGNIDRLSWDDVDEDEMAAAREQQQTSIEAGRLLGTIFES
jgi:hypothetical protein